MNRKPAPRPRRMPTRRKRPPAPRRRRAGFPFFIVSLAILIFAIIYIFAGDFIFQRGVPAFAPGRGEIFVSFLDVGQGESIVVRSRGNTILIDGGDQGARGIVLEYLNDAEITRLCYVVATHPHSDHIGGLIPVLRDFEIGSLIKPDVPLEAQDTRIHRNFLEAIYNHDVHVIHPAPGDRLTAGIIEMEVVAPPPGRHSVNDMSVVLRMEHGGTSFLFTGDAEAASERWMVNNARILAACVLSVGHHGSRTSTTEIFLAAVAPEIAVISAGYNNRFGHPHVEVTSRLTLHGVEILRTDELGTIRLISDGRGIRIKESTPPN